MKKLSLLVIISLIASTGCGLFRDTVQVRDVILEKQRIDDTQNPALQRLLQEELGQKNIQLTAVTVKDVTASTNIDYDFCVIADVVVDDKKVECYIYSKDIRVMSLLEKGKSKIDVEGHFSRFFTILDNYYTKIDIIEAEIDLVEEEPAAEEEPKAEEAKQAKE